MSWSVKKSLVGRLVSTHLVLSLVVVVCVGAASWLAGRQLLRDAVLARLETSSRQKETQLAVWVEERMRDLKGAEALVAHGHLRSGPEGPQLALTPALQSLLEDLRTHQPDIYEVLLLDPESGRVLASTESASVGSRRATFNYFIQGRQGPAVQSVYPLPESLRPVLTVSMPVKDASGRTAAVMALHLGLDPIAQIIRNRAGLGDTGESFLVDSASLLVASARGDPEPLRQKTHSEGIARALGGESGQGQYLSAAGTPVLGVYRWVPAYQMALVTEMSQEEAFAPAGRLALTIVVVALGAAVVLGTGAYILSRRVAQPVLDVTAAAMRVAAGDLTARAPVETEDELGNLSRAFNAMTEELSELYRRLEQEGKERGAILQGSFDGIAVVEKSGAVVYCNPGMERLFGCSRQEVPSLALLADRIFPRPEERQAFIGALADDMAQDNPPERVFSFQHKGGATRWCRLKVSPMGGERLVLNAQDLTEIKASEERVRHMALHDHLTGLPNRQLFLDRLEQALRRAKRLGLRVAILYIDLDHFKSLNDSYGHAHGDRVLVETGLRLKACVRESDTVARLGGDEFVVVLPDLLHGEDALPVAEKIHQSLYDPEAGGGRMFLGASVGLACYPDHGQDQDTLLARADAAMYEAKRSGGNAVRLAPSQTRVVV